MRNIALLCLFLASLVSENASAFDWGSFTPPPRTIPFIENGVVYNAFVQMRYPWIAQNYIVYYPENITEDQKPVGVDYNQGPPYQHLMVLLNPVSYYQAYDSTDYNPDVIVYLCTGNSICQNNVWSDLVPSDRIWYRHYTWFDWNYAGPTGYDLRSDLVRAVGIDVKVNFGYDWDGQFGLPELSAGDVLVQGSAVFKWPLTGSLADRGTPSMQFGNAWQFGECPTGTDKVHVGLDVTANASEEVYAAHTGVVRKIFTGQHSTWADAIVIEDINGQFTTVYWHVIKHGDLAVNDTVVKGQHIADIADLGGNTHFHLGVRAAAFNDPESYAGALPEVTCGGYAAFPEYFVDPESMSYD